MTEKVYLILSKYLLFLVKPRFVEGINALITMPELITTSDFMKETWEDFKSPTTSNFVHRMNPCKNTVNSFEEVSGP